MPGAKKPKDIYLAKSMEKLNDMIDHRDQAILIKVSNLKRICNTASSMYTRAEIARQAGDEELAYVLYMRYFRVIQVIKSSPEYKGDKGPYDRLMSFKHQQNAIEYASELQSSLSKRYNVTKAISNSLDNKMKEMDETADVVSKISLNDDKGSNKAIPSPLYTQLSPIPSNFLHANAPESLSSVRLYQLLEDNSNSVLVIDARSSKDFLESHIKHEMVINIPEETLQPGMTAAKIEKMIMYESKLLWNKRSYVDCVVLMDWSSEESFLKVGHPLHIIKEAMCKWDQSTHLKTDPVVLQGGYEDFLLHYPTLTTNAAVKAPLQKASLPEVNSRVEVDYPNFDILIAKHADNVTGTAVAANGDFAKKSQGTTSLPNCDVSGSNLLPLVFDQSNRPKRTPTVDPPAAKGSHFFKEKVDVTAETFGFSKSIPNSSAKTVKIPEMPASGISASGVPHFDRHLKPKQGPEQSNGDSADARYSASRSADSSSDAANSVVDKPSYSGPSESEISMEALRRRKESEAEETMRKVLQEQTTVLQGEVYKLTEENSMLKERWANAETELEEKNKDLQEVKKNLETVVSAEQYHRQKEIQRLREDRKRREMEQSSEPSAETKIVTAKVDSKGDGNFAEKDKDHDDSSLLNVKGGYSVKLVDDRSGASGSAKSSLSRSHSSPNIAQMIGDDNESPRAFPTFNRAVKPTQSLGMHPKPMCLKPKVAELNAARQRNLSPIYGNQGSGVTGLKNLGNTCFMNSVLQCLAHSKPLARYFYSECYLEDINSDNKQGSGGRVAEEFAVVIKAMWYGHYKSIAPTDFKNTVSKHLAVCVGYEQQDSHEFLVVLMEKLHGDLNKVRRTRSKLPALDDTPETEAMTIFWQHHNEGNKSLVVDLFEGLLMSTLKCVYCEKKSNSFEVFSCLSLPISSSKCSLKDCLRSFLSEEKMAGEGAWDCPQCRQKREAGKKMVICQLPKILVIHLKR